LGRSLRDALGMAAGASAVVRDLVSDVLCPAKEIT